MLSSRRLFELVREFYRDSPCSPSCFCSFVSLLFYTGAFTTPTCPRQPFPHLCTITTGDNSIVSLCCFFYISFAFAYVVSLFFYSYRTDCESPASFSCSYPVANISLLRNKKHVGTNSCRHKFNYTLFRHKCHIILGLFNY